MAINVSPGTAKMCLWRAGVPAEPKPGHTRSPPDLSRRNKGLLFFLWSVLASIAQGGSAGKLMANAPILFLPFGTYLNYSFFWLTCTIARPPVSTFRLSVPLPAAGLSKPKIRRATVSIFPPVRFAKEFHPFSESPNDQQPFRLCQPCARGSVLRVAPLPLPLIALATVRLHLIAAAEQLLLLRRSAVSSRASLRAPTPYLQKDSCGAPALAAQNLKHRPS